MSVGGIIQFTFLSTFCWFCCSVFNVMVALLTLSTDSMIKRHPKAVFLVEFCLATVIPGGIVAIVYSTSSYTPGVLLMYICTPDDNDNLFYSYTLPTQICSIVVMTMSIIIIRRLKQVYRTHMCYIYTHYILIVYVYP